MRVIAGTARGRTLKTVRGLAIRPTPDRVRESLFNVLQPVVSGCAFLDLFAGSGAVGIEALSRGAARAVFVEQAAAHLQVLAQNLATTGLAGRAELLRRDALQAVALLARRQETFDLVFLDPPYGQGLVPATLAALAEHGLVAPGGLVICEHHRKDLVPGQAGVLVRCREVVFGETVLSFYRAQPAGGSAPGGGG